MIEAVLPGDVPDEWDAILYWLHPAFKWTETTPDELRAELLAGVKTPYRLSGDVVGYVVASMGEARDTGALAVWINWAGGRSFAGLDAMRRVITEIEGIGLGLGAVEARAAGRPGWVRVFRALGYERLADDGQIARLRKVLGNAGRK